MEHHFPNRGWSRRGLLKLGASALIVSPFLAACGGTASSPPTSGPTTSAPTAGAAPTQAPATPTPAPAAAPTKAAAATMPAKSAEPTTVKLEINSAIKEEGVLTDTGTPPKYGTYWEAQVYTTHLQKFMDQNPDIKVVVDWWQGTDASKILALKASGTLGDLIHSLRVPFDVMARNELIRPLDDIVKSNSVDLSQWYPATLSLFRFDVKTGKHGANDLPLMGLPIIAYSGATILFYNADMFDKKGVKPPTSDMSFDDIVQTAVKMTDRPSGSDAAKVYGFMEAAYGGDIMATWVRDFGGEVLDDSGTKALFASKEMKSTWQFILDLFFQSKVHPLPDQQKALGDYHAMFVQQKVAMFRHPPWGVLATTSIPGKGNPGHFEWGAIAMPKGPSGQRGSQLGGTVVGMNPQTKATDAAMKVLVGLANHDAAVLQCFNAGGCGPRPDVVSDPKVSADKFLQITQSLLPDAKIPHYAANGRDSEVGATWGTEWSKLINGQAKLDDAFMANVNKLVQDVLNRPPV